MYRRFFLIIITVLIPIFSFAQPKLKIEPDKIEFKSEFNRLKNVLFINEGTDTLSIDSIYYNNSNIFFNFYFLRFDVYSRFPMHIAPGDTIKMDCILTNYYYIPANDTSDNLIIYSNGIDPVMNIKITSYSHDTGGWGTILGNITANKLPVDNAMVHIIHNGSRIGKSIYTDASGFFSIKVPNGLYTVAAEKDSFYTTFFGQTFSPYSSKIINLKKDDTAVVDINLAKMQKTGYSICGQIMDSLSLTPLKRSIIIASKGRHTPSKLNGFQNDSLPVNSYTAIINPDDGTYHIDNITEPGYYLIQSFSDYYVPSYYRTNDLSSPFWKNADSVYIDNNICDLNILMPRDSSFGNGKISGTVKINQGSGSNFSDVIVFAQSVESKSIFNHSLVEDDGSFTISDLPYGYYYIIAQKRGYTNVYSNELILDTLNTTINNVEINFDVASVSKKTILPVSPILYQNYPNPFNPSTNIKFFLPKGSNTTLKIVNILGEEVKTIYKGYLSSGNYKFNFNAAGYGSGVYFVILNTRDSRLVRKIVLLK